jgi:hypothetical protein
LTSAGRVAGISVNALRREVRDGFVGPTTCTHLNDTLRSLQDVSALLGALRDDPSGSVERPHAIRRARFDSP